MHLVKIVTTILRRDKAKPKIYLKQLAWPALRVGVWFAGARFAARLQAAARAHPHNPGGVSAQPRPAQLRLHHLPAAPHARGRGRGRGRLPGRYQPGLAARLPRLPIVCCRTAWLPLSSCWQCQVLNIASKPRGNCQYVRITKNYTTALN